MDTCFLGPYLGLNWSSGAHFMGGAWIPPGLDAFFVLSFRRVLQTHLTRNLISLSLWGSSGTAKFADGFKV